MNKLNNYEVINKETGEILNNGVDIINSIKKEEYKNTIKALCWKIENKPFDMSIDELTAYRIMVKKKRGKTIRYKITSGEFVTLMTQDSETIKKLNVETKAMLYETSMMTNKSGILLYKNNKPIASFEKLRKYLEIGHSRWSKLKKDIDDYNIIIKRRDINERNVLIINPFFSTTSTEVTEIRFITFGHLLKEKIDFDDYLYLCKLHNIIPEYEVKPIQEDVVLSDKKQSDNHTTSTI